MLGDPLVAAVLADHRSADISPQLRETLTLLEKVTRAHERLSADDFRPALAAGVTRAQLEDALHVAFCFNVITRLADTFAFRVGTAEEFAMSAKMLLTRGYKI